MKKLTRNTVLATKLTYRHFIMFYKHDNITREFCATFSPYFYVEFFKKKFTEMTSLP